MSVIQYIAPPGTGGNATPDHVLEPDTFTSDSGQQTGTMVDHTDQSPVQVTWQGGIPTEVRIIVPGGFYPDTTSTLVFAFDPNLLAANIPVGITIFDISGTFSSDADATAADIAVGKTAYVNGVKITGTAT